MMTTHEGTKVVTELDQDIVTSRVTNQDIERLKRQYPLPQFEEKFLWAVNELEKQRELAAQQAAAAAE